MQPAGERRPEGRWSVPPARRQGRWERLRPRTLRIALLEAAGVAALAAAAWAVMRGVLEFPGALAVAVAGGWAIGALLWQVRATPLLAALVAALAWLAGLILTWLLAMAILPGSSRTFLERVQHTPFLDWLAPQLGLLEIVGLGLYLLAAVYGARPRGGHDA